MNFSINKVAVIGAGVMGAGIAAHVAGAGIPVCLLDIVPRELSEEDKKNGLTLESKAFRNKFSQAGKDKVMDPKFGTIFDRDMGNLIQVGNLTDDIEMLKECDWIVEVVVERLDIKKNLMKQIQENSKPSAIISTNTSGVSINKIVEEMPLEFKQRFLGTHFFNPPRYMNLFEIIPGNDTNSELLAFMKKFGSKILGKGVVVAKDTPNFIGNRVGTFAVVDTIKSMDKYGLSFEEVDLITGSLMGRPRTATFGTLDMVGIDILYHVSNNVIENVEDEKEKEDFKLPQYILELMENSQLGDKTKQGIYKKLKTPKGKTKLVWDVNSKQYVELTNEKIAIVEEAKKGRGFNEKLNTLIGSEDKYSKFAWGILKNTLLYSANRVPEIADDYREIDNAMKWGYNWEAGPFELWDIIGVEKSIERMKEEGEVIPAWIEERIASGKINFYEEVKVNNLSSAYKVIKETKDAALLDMGDGVVCFEYRTRSNAISEGLMDMLIESIKEVEKNPEYKGMVMGNIAKNFSTGGDLAQISQYASEENWDSLSKMVDKFHNTSMAIKYAKKPIVAAPHGMVLGGGLELTMHCHKVIAHSESYMGLVEVGVGIIPAGGGTKELLYRWSQAVEELNLTDYNQVIKKVWETIAMAKVSRNAFEAQKLGFLRQTDRIVLDLASQLDEAKKEVIRMSEDGFRQSINKPVKVWGAAGKAFLAYIVEIMKQGKFISSHDALIAVEVANVICGGDIPKGTLVSEKYMLDLEKETVLSLVKNEKSQQRMMQMLTTGKPLRN